MAKHIQQRARFDSVRYANCWEDAEILCSALEPDEGKRFLSVASAGDNSFSLLSHGAEVIAADLSPAQLACVELRKAAFLNLNHEQVLCFFGIRQSENRLATYQSIKSSMPDQAIEFWENQPAAIRNGFIHAGKFESYFAKFRNLVLPLVHSRKRINQLLRSKSQAERIEFYDRHWNTWRWRLLFKMFFSRFVMGRLGRDPEFFRYVEGSVAQRILDRTKHAVTELETHNNPFLTYILTGNYGGSLPHYLRAENFCSVRSNLHRLQTFQGSVEDAAEKFAAGRFFFDGYNLSDIFEYLSPAICESIYARLLQVARPAARFAYWNMLVPRRCPDSLRQQVIQHDDLPLRLFMKNKAWFYSAFVLEEKK